MLYLVSWTIHTDHRNAAIKRFLGNAAQPPDGVKLLGRWHAVGPLTGVALAETDDAQALFHWFMQWSDLLCFDVVPAITDKELGQTLQESQPHWWQHE